MSTTDRIERDITLWFDETAAPSMPDYTEDLIRQTAGSRQRPRWTFLERWLPMSVITLGRVTLRPVPWRTVGLLVALGLLLAIAAVAYVGSSQPRVPAPFGTAANGVAAYSKGGDIYTVDPATGARRAVVTGGATDERPVFSLDGTRLAFARATGTGSVIVLADADGSNQIEVPMTPLPDVFPPSWSPDGRYVAVISGDGETGTLSIVDTIDRTIRKTNVVTDFEEVQWRPPDGRQLMVTVRVSGRVKFVLVSAIDGGVEVLTSPVADAGGGLRPGGWSLDGRRFLYAGGNDQVRVLDMEGGPDVVIATGGFPRFSNDGRRIVFMEWGSGDESWLSVAPSDGSERSIRVSDVFHVAIGNRYAWSPDDTAILLEPQFGGARVLLDPDGGPASAPPWLTDEIQSWQRLAP